jgi:hypothetical protein
MPMPDRDARYQQYVLEDQLREWLGYDTPETLYDEQCAEEVRTMAEAELAQRALGLVPPRTLLVIPDTREVVRWASYGRHFIAIEPQDDMEGCLHTVTAALDVFARGEAVAEHRLGKRCTWKPRNGVSW